MQRHQIPRAARLRTLAVLLGSGEHFFQKQSHLMLRLSALHRVQAEAELVEDLPGVKWYGMADGPDRR